jgi:hypothetical protein
MSLTNRPLLIGLLVVFTVIQAWLSVELMSAGFDWRRLWGAPIVKATLLDFTFTVAWCALYLLDAARKQQRNGWAWIPLLLILPTFALFLFTLTERRGGADENSHLSRDP